MDTQRCGPNTHWKRGHDPSCTQTASLSGRDTQRVSAYLPQSGRDTAGDTGVGGH